MFKIKFLPARFGDSILIEYGTEKAPRRVLIDGGTSRTRHDIRCELMALPVDQRRFELLVVSHVDRDHIEGILGLLSEADPGFEVYDLWFNGWPHLPGNPEIELFGAVQGERLTERILKLGLPWNRAFKGKAVFVPNDGPLPQIALAGGMQLTLLSPRLEALDLLKPKWEQEVRAANLDPGFALQPNEDIDFQEDEEFGGEDIPDIEALSNSKFEGDGSEANGSSIAFLADFDGKRALLAADAHAEVLESALKRFSPGERVSIDLFKISHHGSKNTTSVDLLERVDCPRYVFSTNGSVYKHPHAEAVSRVIVTGGYWPELVFNYRSARNQVWDLDLLKNQHSYQTIYPNSEEPGITIEL